MVDSRAVLATAQLPDTSVFFLGCFESRLTVVSQQRRALNLVDAILAERLVRPNGRVAIVGAGAAGLTAAAAFAVAAPELRIDLFERAGLLMHLQQSSDRDLHPHIYDWPAAGSADKDAGLPMLNWQAGPAKHVAKQITANFDRIQRQAGGRLAVHLNHFVSSVTPKGKGSCQVKTEQRPNETNVYDAVILAIGFGYERIHSGFPECSYWMPTQLLGPFSPDPVLFISGNGDGGLVDFAVAAFQQLDHSALINLVVCNSHIGLLNQELLEIEKRAWADQSDGYDILADYRKLEIPSHLLLDVFDNLRPDAEIWLHTHEPNLFRRTTAILNRFTAFLVMQADAMYRSAPKIHYRTKAECIAAPGQPFQIGTERFRPTVSVFRYGAAKEVNRKPFEDLVRRFLAAQPAPEPGYRPATPELTAGGLERFKDDLRETVTVPVSTEAPATPFAQPGTIDAAAEARRWLSEHGIACTLESLDVHIRSGIPEAIVRFMQTGLSPDTLLNGITPLELALSELENAARAAAGGQAQSSVAPSGPLYSEPEPARADVVKALVAAGPRDVARAAHEALANGSPLRLIALLRAGVGLDCFDAAGQSLAARAMRKDDDAPHSSPIGWTELLVRKALQLPSEAAAWILLWAASTDRIGLVRRLLERGVPVNASLQGRVPTQPLRDSELAFWWPGGTALHRLLARRGSYSELYGEPDLYSTPLLQLLLSRGASATVVDARGCSPLHMAAREGLTQAAQQLLDGSDLTQRDAEGETALLASLHWPRSSGIAKMLIARALPADPVERGCILHRAVSIRDADLVRQLLDAGCDPDALCDGVPGAILKLAQGWNFIGPRDRESAVPCLSLLLERGGNPNLPDSSGWTALHWLVQGKELDAVDRLLAEGADPNAVDEKGRTVLMNVRTVAIAQRLLAAGAEPGRRDRYGHDALDHAIIHGSDEVIAHLTPADGEVRLEARLIRAVIQRDAAKVSELLSLGGHADTVDAFGQPALHLAAAACCPDIMRPLLDHGAAVDGRDAAGCTAIHGCLWSFEAHREDLEASLTLLLDRGASVLAVDRPGADGEAAIFKGHFWWRLPVVASRLLQACRDQRSRNGATALMAAVEYGTARQVADLLRERLDPRTVDNRGRTALHYAAAGGFNQYVDMEYAKKARLLVDGGATVDVTTATGETPLMAAVAVANDEMIELLLQEGANAEARNAAGQSLQQIALQARNVGLVNRFSQRASPSDGSAPMPLAES